MVDGKDLYRLCLGVIYDTVTAQEHLAESGFPGPCGQTRETSTVVQPLREC